MSQEILAWIGSVNSVACIAVPTLHLGIKKRHWPGKVDALSRAGFIAVWAKRNWVVARVIHSAKMLQRRLRMQRLELRMFLFKSRILCLQRGYLSGYEPELRFNIVLCRVVINHPLEFVDVLRDAAHIVTEAVKRRNEKYANVCKTRVPLLATSD